MQQREPARYAGRSYSKRECDALTGVADQKCFQKIVDRALGEAGVRGCLLILDVDRMQEINALALKQETGSYKALLPCYRKISEAVTG